MGITHSELNDAIEKIAPAILMDDWDNCGIQIKTSNKTIEKILVALEITDEIIEEAVFKGADIIITHHPLIFQGIRQISTDDATGRYINKLISKGISVYSVHTSFDKAAGGNNDYLISLLELEISGESGSGNFAEACIGRLGVLKKSLKLGLILKAVENALGIPKDEIRTVGTKDKVIKRIAVCTGSGASLINDAIKNNCDLLVTGDVKYHDAQYAGEMGLALIDAGHYYTEKTFSKNFSEKLANIVGEKIIIIESQIDINPFGK